MLAASVLLPASRDKLADGWTNGRTDRHQANALQLSATEATSVLNKGLFTAHELN